MSLQLLTIYLHPPHAPLSDAHCARRRPGRGVAASLSGSASVLGFTSLPRVFANASGRIEFIIFLIMDWSFASGCSPPVSRRRSCLQLRTASALSDGDFHPTVGAHFQAHGGSARRAAVQKMVESLGGRLEAFFFTFGENDILVILDLPENLTAATLSLAVMSTGVVRTNTKVLLTPEEIDRSVKAPVDFQPPG